MNAQARDAAPLDEVMLAMDVVDTLRHEQAMVTRELGAEARETALIERLRKIYHDQGIEVPDRILAEGVKALEESRFTYTPPPPSWRTQLARLYVTRRRWGLPVLVVLGLLVVGVLGYAFVYQPIQRGQAEAAQIELAETLPARIDEIYDAIYTETKVQSALEEADPWVERGKAAAARGDREGALAAIAQLESIHDTLLREYTLRIVNREGEDTGIWTFPEINTEATNYYIVVEAIAPDGAVLTLPILNEETGLVDEVSTWAVRVPESTYNAVRVDRLDDGIIQRNTMGVKQYGFMDIDYLMPVQGGAITQW